MRDTPEHIKKFAVKIWLSKSPAERLSQMMADNDALMKFWSNAKKTKKQVTKQIKL